MKRLTAEQYFYLENELTKLLDAVRPQPQDGKVPHWTSDAWVNLLGALDEYGPSMRECGPMGVVMYTETALLVTRYLGERPDMERFKRAHQIIGRDLVVFIQHMACMHENDLRKHFGASRSAMLRLDGKCLSEAESDLVYRMGAACIDAHNRLGLIVPQH